MYQEWSPDLTAEIKNDEKQQLSTWQEKLCISYTKYIIENLTSAKQYKKQQI